MTDPRLPFDPRLQQRNRWDTYWLVGVPIFLAALLAGGWALGRFAAWVHR